MAYTENPAFFGEGSSEFAHSALNLFRSAVCQELRNPTPQLPEVPAIMADSSGRRPSAGPPLPLVAVDVRDGYITRRNPGPVKGVEPRIPEIPS